MERFRHTVEGHKFLTKGGVPLKVTPNVDVMWQSVDHSMLSTPTRPGTPNLDEAQNSIGFDFSPSLLFDFPIADYGATYDVDLGDFDTFVNFTSTSHHPELQE